MAPKITVTAPVQAAAQVTEAVSQVAEVIVEAPVVEIATAAPTEAPAAETVSAQTTGGPPPANDPSIGTRLQALKDQIAKLRRDGYPISPNAASLELMTADAIAMDPNLALSLDMALSETGLETMQDAAGKGIGAIVGAEMAIPGVMGGDIAGLTNPLTELAIVEAARHSNDQSQQPQQPETQTASVTTQSQSAETPVPTEPTAPAVASTDTPEPSAGFAPKRGGAKAAAAVAANTPAEPKAPDFRTSGLPIIVEKPAQTEALRNQGKTIGGIALASNMQEATGAQYFASPDSGIPPLDHGLGARMSQGKQRELAQGQGQGGGMQRSLNA